MRNKEYILDKIWEVLEDENESGATKINAAKFLMAQIDKEEEEEEEMDSIFDFAAQVKGA